MDLRRSVCVSKKRLHRFFEKGSGAARKALSALGKNSRGGLWGPNVAEMERFELEGAFFTANDSLIKYGFIAYLFKSSIF